MTEAEINGVFFAIPEHYRKEARWEWVECGCVECLFNRALAQALADKIDREMMEADA